jgi:curved DNA-binding protein CbpA
LQISVASILNAKDHFSVLGLEPKRCCGSMLRKAYRHTALKVHPDKCDEPRAIEAFRRLQEAFAVLSDPSLHARYAQMLASHQANRYAKAAAGRARERNAAYAARSRMTKEDLERQVREMMASQSKSRPMAQSEAARKAAMERVAKEKARQARLDAEERARKAEADKRREQAEKALNSARNRPKTPRTPKQRPHSEDPVDPEAKKSADERARRRAASMSFLRETMKWTNLPQENDSQPGTARGGSDSDRRPSSARSPQSSPFGDLRTMKRAQTERLARRPVPASSYLPRYMQNKAKAAPAIKVKI